MTTGEKIAALRREKGLSQEALGEQLGLSRQAVSKWEADQAVPTMDNLVELSRLFGVPVDTILRPEEELPGKGQQPPEGVRISAEGLKISYAPVLTKKTRWFIIALAALLFVSVTGNLYAMVRVQGMQGEIGALREQMNGLYAQMNIVQPAAQEQPSDDFTQMAVDCGFDGKMLNFSVSVVPKQFDAEETAQFLIRYGGDKANCVDEVSTLNGGYTADFDIAPVEACQIYLQLTKNDQTRTLLVKECNLLDKVYAMQGSVQAPVETKWDAIQPFTATVVMETGITEWGERAVRPVGGRAELLIGGQAAETKELQLVPEGEAVPDVNGSRIRYGNDVTCLYCDFSRHPIKADQQYEVRVYITDNFGREFQFSNI